MLGSEGYELMDSEKELQYNSGGRDSSAQSFVLRWPGFEVWQQSKVMAVFTVNGKYLFQLAPLFGVNNLKG